MPGIERFPEIYTIPPPQPKESKIGQLTQAEVKQFFEEGFLIKKDFFTKDELQEAIDGVNEKVENLASTLFKAGKIKDKHEDASFFKRLTLIEAEFPGAAVLMHKRGFLPQGFKNVWTNERLLNVIEQFIGQNIAGHPVWNLRTKTPGNVEATVPWHQDNAYLEAKSDSCLIPTAWIPLIDANQENGCLKVVRGGHRKGFTAKHTCCAGPTWYVQIEEDEIRDSLGVDIEKDSVLCEIPFGGVLFLNNLIPHKSLQNYSDNIRWSLDLRWHKPDTDNYFYGVKKSVLMRTESDSEYKINWTSFTDGEHQHQVEEKFVKEEVNINPADLSNDADFDTTISGPWMMRWEIVHHNKHVAKLTNPDGKVGYHGIQFFKP